MSTISPDAAAAPRDDSVPRTTLAVLVALSVCHGLNDTIQSLLPAVYPLLQQNYALTFGEVGIIHFAFMATASLLQPAVGIATDKRPVFQIATLGMGASLIGLVVLAFAGSYGLLLVSAMMIGVGSSIFHPDSSRTARAASGGRYGFAQSLFQVGGNTGSAIGPLLAAFIVLPFGQSSIAWFAALALIGMVVLYNVGAWAKREHIRVKSRPKAAASSIAPPRHVPLLLAMLGVLVISKYVYMASLNGYYTFYLIDTFGLSVGQSQLMLFVFLAAVAAGTFAGGPIGDRIGRKAVIVVSILGVLPFSLALPHVGLVGTGIMSAAAGFILASAFSAILVYAQHLVPGRVGLVSGLFFGFAFGIGGIGAALLGFLADAYGIQFVYQVCSVLPAAGIIGIFLPAEPRSR
ncbi:MFS transporter [Acuticoccus sediminis]|uniref:MFS transporter n=1 Tax=Acuticoccus sediminis TaxID=2184697 RepID=A0A8B2NW95_9HYPH|nr:MFS transporter [Acuticoccus sediminis]RAI02588.1 MFS transporter [Acuticoccus sediminis]